jgi:hypothetical protein
MCINKAVLIHECWMTHILWMNTGSDSLSCLIPLILCEYHRWRPKIWPVCTMVHLLCMNTASDSLIYALHATWFTYRVYCIWIPPLTPYILFCVLLDSPTVFEYHLWRPKICSAWTLVHLLCMNTASASLYYSLHAAYCVWISPLTPHNMLCLHLDSPTVSEYRLWLPILFSARCLFHFCVWIPPLTPK